MAIQHHEDFSRDVHGQGASDRSFGFVFTAFFLLLGLWPRVHGRPIRLAWIALAAGMLAITLIRASLLHPLNRIWTGIGRVLGKVMNPVVTGLLFFTVFTPVAVFLRWRRKDLLALAGDPDAETYWIKRGTTAENSSMVNQF